MCSRVRKYGYRTKFWEEYTQLFSGGPRHETSPSPWRLWRLYRGRAMVLAVTRRPVSAESGFDPWSFRVRSRGTQIVVRTDLSNSAEVSVSFYQFCILTHLNVY